MDWLIIIGGLAAALVAGILIRRALVAAVVIAAILLVSMAAQAHASVRIHAGTSGVYCHHYGVTEYRTGVTGGILGDLWRSQTTLYWCAYPVSAPHSKVWNLSVRRTNWVDAFWNFGGYQIKTKIRHLTSPTRYNVRTKVVMIGQTATWANEHNYPYVSITMFKQSGRVEYVAHCGC